MDDRTCITIESLKKRHKSKIAGRCLFAVFFAPWIFILFFCISNFFIDNESRVSKIIMQICFGVMIVIFIIVFWGVISSVIRSFQALKRIDTGDFLVSLDKVKLKRIQMQGDVTTYSIEMEKSGSQIVSEKAFLQFEEEAFVYVISELDIVSIKDEKRYVIVGVYPTSIFNLDYNIRNKMV